MPRHFLIGGATGIAGLRLEADYITDDVSAAGDSIRVSGAIPHGTLLEEGTFSQTVGTMAHEFGHGLGLPDLYDLDYDSPEEDSAGIGKWGLMGWGAHGWHGDDGPNPLCAASREQLGWLGRDNERLVEVGRDTVDMVLAALDQGGMVARIPLASPYGREYLLLEQRMRTAPYDAHLPAEGLLVWHVNTVPNGNDREDKKFVDLVCADGLYGDAGFPAGAESDPYAGGDNLDFWAHDDEYAQSHNGNLGDATDPFDGVRFAALNGASNPSTTMRGRWRSAYTGPGLVLRPRAGAMVVDVRQPRWGGTIAERMRWSGELIVDGDLEIEPGGSLFVFAPSRVRFAATDRLGRGLDAERCELRVEGELRVMRSGSSAPEASVVFEALVPGTTWRGILAAEGARLHITEGCLELRDVARGRPDPASLDSGPLTAILEGSGDEATGSARVGAASFGQLLPNYPNPFNAETTIRYALRQPSAVRLTVYDMLGQRVRVLVDGVRSEGTHAVVWDGRDERGEWVSSGTYFCRLEARRAESEFSEGLRMTLLK